MSATTHMETGDPRLASSVPSVVGPVTRKMARHTAVDELLSHDGRFSREDPEDVEDPQGRFTLAGHDDLTPAR